MSDQELEQAAVEQAQASVEPEQEAAEPNGEVSASVEAGERVIEIPDFGLVLLVGVSGSGKSTFAARHFLSTEVLSSDAFRGWVCDDPNSLEATDDAFEALYHLAAIRLRRRRLVVLDATNVQPEARKAAIDLAARHDVLAVAVVLVVPEAVCQARNRERPDRQMGPHVVRNQARQLRQSLRSLRREGFRYVYLLDGPAAIDAARFVRRPVWTDLRTEHGPFDIVGDVHGCTDELEELLGLLGYARPAGGGAYAHREGRRLVFLGDLVDRGPRIVDAARIAMEMVGAGTALCVPGNHDVKLMRALQGRDVRIAHGLQQSLAQIEALPDDERVVFTVEFAAFANRLVSHYVLDDGKLVVAHGGMKEEYQGRASARVRDFALYGDTTGETDEFGLPVRYPWAEEYRGTARVVYGHTPVPEAEWLNRTINIDTGCVFGGKLTALRYPEREVVQVPARRVYAEPARPFLPEPAEGEAAEPAAPSLQWQADELLRAEDVLGKHIVHTRVGGNVVVRAENAAAALEVMSRYAVEPRWLVYLPPTMSPCETASEPGYLEYPAQAFAYYRAQGVPRAVCQSKHMGSRAVVVICRDEEAAARRFGVRGTLGECFTRTGRRFFDDEAVHREFVAEVARAMGAAGLWDELKTDWACLDCELMPWNAKAQALLRDQYAPVGAAASLAVPAAKAAVDVALARLRDPAASEDGAPRSPAALLAALSARLESRGRDVEGYVAAYGHYCWPVDGLQGIRLAPFHLLATEGRTHFDQTHEWHVTTLARLAEHSPMLAPTEWRAVDLLDERSQAAATEWWLAHTGAGGEGMVVKPLQFVARGARGLVQPAVKVRGREYLRIIYGPEYTEPENLERLRSRSLGAKRSLAAREFAVGLEGLERFVAGEPLRRVHECAFAVLALESEPVDPRL